MALWSLPTRPHRPPPAALLPLAAGSLLIVLFFCCLLVYKTRVLAEAVDPTLSPYFKLIYDSNDLLLTVGMFVALVAGLVVSLLAYAYALVEARR